MRAVVFNSLIGILLAVMLPLAQAKQKTAKQPLPNRGQAKVSANGSSDDPVATINPATYVIGPTDVLEISVWREPDVSRSVMVRPDGKISLPLINDVQAAGLTPMQLADHVAGELKKYMTEPQVTVTVTAPNSQKVYVVGEVNRPGDVALLPNATVLDALASAGGLTQFANGKKIFILRTEGGKQVRYYFDYQAAVKGDLRQNIPLKPGDTIVVP